eukprot:3152507-Rhodomonas_salina.2
MRVGRDGERRRGREERGLTGGRRGGGGKRGSGRTHWEEGGRRELEGEREGSGLREGGLPRDCDTWLSSRAESVS